MAIPEILIVSGTGQVGSELISLLTQASISVRVLTRPASSRKIAENSRITFAKGDLADPECIASTLIGISHVFLLTRDQPN